MADNRAMSGIYDRNTPPDPQPPATAPKAGMPASVPDLGTASARARARVLHWMRRRGSPVPGNLGDMSSMIATALQIVKGQKVDRVL